MIAPNSEGKAMLNTSQGRRVVVDDNLPVRAGTTDGGVFTTYLFGQGAFARGSSRLVKLTATCGPLDIDDSQPAITVKLPDED